MTHTEMAREFNQMLDRQIDLLKVFGWVLDDVARLRPVEESFEFSLEPGNINVLLTFRYQTIDDMLASQPTPDDMREGFEKMVRSEPYPTETAVLAYKLRCEIQNRVESAWCRHTEQYKHADKAAREFSEYYDGRPYRPEKEQKRQEEWAAHYAAVVAKARPNGEVK